MEQWRFAEGVWIPKAEGSKLLDQFRLISLLNTESKIFFSLLSRRLSDFFLGNVYINTSVHKGVVAGMPGCLEHTGVLTAPERGKGKQRTLDSIMGVSR